MSNVAIGVKADRADHTRMLEVLKLLNARRSPVSALQRAMVCTREAGIVEVLVEAIVEIVSGL